MVQVALLLEEVLHSLMHCFYVGDFGGTGWESLCALYKEPAKVKLGHGPYQSLSHGYVIY